ncbi:Coatomer subunit beta', partial [Vespula maculifrons]
LEIAIFSYNTSVHEGHNICHIRSSLIKELNEQLAKSHKSTKHNLNSSKDVAECEASNLQMINNTIFIQFKYIECRIEIDRTIFHCGMHSHISLVHNEQREYLHPSAMPAIAHDGKSFTKDKRPSLSSTPAKGLNVATHRHMRRLGRPNIRKNYVIRLLCRH